MIRYLMILILLTSAIRAENDINEENFIAGDNYGTEFYFTFIPSFYYEYKNKIPNLIIYIASVYDTDVTLEIEQLGYSETKSIAANNVIEFILPAEAGQPYLRDLHDKPKPDSLFIGKGIHIFSDMPVTVYAITRNEHTSDGILVIPKEMLGTEYIIASYATFINQNTFHYNSQFAVVGTEDNTLVDITVGGNDFTETAGGLEPGDVASKVLNKGDIWLIEGLSHYSDLSGTIVKADKPVSVLSGHYCANVPINFGSCDCLYSMEIPTNKWGNNIVVPNILHRKKNPVIKIFAKEPGTSIYRNGNQIGYIETPGGIEGEGFLHIRSYSGEPQPVLFQGSKPISITLFNPGTSDDRVTGDPFQMILTPMEQSHKQIVFTTPGIVGSSFGFNENFLTIIYMYGENYRLDESFEIGRVVDNEIIWERLADEFGYKINGSISYNNSMIYMKLLPLPEDGLYYIRGDLPFISYSYGTSPYDSYGYPTSLILNDLENTSGVYTLFAEDASAEPGEIVNIELKLKSDNNETIPEFNIDVLLSFNKTLLAPIDYDYHSIDGDKASILLKNLTTKPNGDLAKIKFLSALGNSVESSLELSDAKIFPFRDFSSEDGLFTLLGLCEEGGVRLINPNNKSFVSMISPNPATDKIDFEYGLNETGFTKLYITDAAGRIIRTILSENITQTGNFDESLSADNLSNGIYYIILETPTQRFNRKFVISK